MFIMGRIIPMSWLNQILLILSILGASLSLVIQEWVGLTPLPIYVSILWIIFIIIMSVWLSCYLFQLALKAKSPLNITFLNDWLYQKLVSSLKLPVDKKLGKALTEKNTDKDSKTKSTDRKVSKERSIASRRKRLIGVNDLVKEINSKCIRVWYESISNDKSFPDEAQELLKKLLTKLFYQIHLIDKVKLTHQLANVFLLHFKEYHRASRRVEKGSAKSMQEAFKYLHPGSRNASVLEHMLHQMISILAQEFLQWELTSSLPCKLLLSILAKRLLLFIETVSSPDWLFQSLLELLQPASNEGAKTQDKVKSTEENILRTKKLVSEALCDGITSSTAAIIPRPIPKPKSNLDNSTKATTENKGKTLGKEKIMNEKRPTLRLDNLSTEHRGLWGQSLSEGDIELDEDKLSPVYEDTTDFATTIARLRTVLQQKSTVTTPLHVEEKSYAVYEGSQFINLLIPWTEFRTEPDGSQQLLYCIQFDDVEQRGVDLFETTTATVRRQYRDFVQLHASLQETPALAIIMKDLVLPEGGRIELENYIITLTTRLASVCPPQLRHFLRPNNGSDKKADVVAPRLDRFLAKTVSGVFNTLKTVVPGFEVEQEEEIVQLPTLMPLADIPWRFVKDVKTVMTRSVRVPENVWLKISGSCTLQKSLASELQKLIADRTDYYSVDTAYEAVDSVEGSNDTALITHWLETVNDSYEEEADELDSQLMLTCAAVDLICELLAGVGSNNALQQEAVVRWTKLLFGNVTESVLQTTIHQIFDYLSSKTFHNVQTKISDEPLVQVREKLVQEMLSKISNDVRLIFGEDDTIYILKYLINSYEIKKINIDLNLHILDVVASQLLVSCRSAHNRAIP